MTLTDGAGSGASSSSSCGALLVDRSGNIEFHGSEFDSNRNRSVGLSDVQGEWSQMMCWRVPNFSLSLSSSGEAGPEVQGRCSPWWCWDPSRTMMLEDTDRIELRLSWLRSRSPGVPGSDVAPWWGWAGMTIFISGDPATQIPAAWSFVRHSQIPGRTMKSPI